MDKIKTYDHSDLKIYTRSGEKGLGLYEKPVILPSVNNNNPTVHAWTDAHFATDIMAEHALFLPCLCPQK